MDINEIGDRILSLEGQCTMIRETLVDPMNHRGEINIPLEEDKVFRTTLKKSLQKVFFDTDRVNYDLLVERIIQHLYEYNMGWGRSVKLVHTSDLTYQLKSILDEIDIPVTNKLVRTVDLMKIHLMPTFALEALLKQNNQLSDINELREQLKYCCQHSYDTFDTEERAMEYGFGLEYRWYNSLFVKLSDEIVSLLKCRAIELHRRLKDKYQPELYCTCCSHHDTRRLPYLREHNPHGTLVLADCVLSVLNMQESEEWLFTTLEKLVGDLYKRCNNTWTLEYFQQNQDEPIPDHHGHDLFESIRPLPEE
jgi:hypothetical protein